jgi:hypothetical protein
MNAEKDTLVCIRQEDTFCWPDYLGKKTEGKCEECEAAIYFEEQNEVFRKKICNRCLIKL